MKKGNKKRPKMLKEGNQKMREKIKRKKAKEENKKPIRDTKNL
mgnify:CR=1 FL=1